MLEMVLNAKTDIICFQEFYSRKRGVYDITDSLLQKGGYTHFEQEIYDSNDNETMSIAIFSKYPIINYEVVQFYGIKHANVCTYADILFMEDTIRVFNIHLQSISFQPEDYQYLDQVKNVETDMQSNKRIGSRLKHAFIHRGDQADQVAQLINESQYPVLVCGDFNDTPASYAFNIISRDLKDSFREKGNGIGVTYNGAFPNFQIDYILCSKAFEVNDYKIIKKKYSDHYPVKAVFSLTNTKEIN